MPIKLSKSDYKKLETIFENQDNNISLSNFYIDMIDLSKSIANKVQKETINKTINGKTFIDTTLDLLVFPIIISTPSIFLISSLLI